MRLDTQLCIKIIIITFYFLYALVPTLLTWWLDLHLLIIDLNLNNTSLFFLAALVALVFTVVSLVNGLASLYAYELRGKLSGNWSKLTHICFGTVAFVAASITLCYGLDKGLFRNWATDNLAYTVIGFVATFTFIIILSPVLTMFSRSKVIVKNIGM